MAGEQYDGDVAAAKAVLGNFSTYYPGATKYNVKGLFWWQGDKDRYDMGLASQYETHLVALIKSLRKDYEAQNVPFVTATLGQTVMGAGGAEGAILDAMFAISNYTKHPEFKGTTATVYTHPYARGGASCAHYGLNAEVYMDVAEHMADAMIGLLKDASEEVVSIKVAGDCSSNPCCEGSKCAPSDYAVPVRYPNGWTCAFASCKTDADCCNEHPECRMAGFELGCMD